MDDHLSHVSSFSEPIIAGEFPGPNTTILSRDPKYTKTKKEDITHETYMVTHNRIVSMLYLSLIFFLNPCLFYVCSKDKYYVCNVYLY